MQKITSRQKAFLLALLAVLFWSTISSAIKLTLKFLSFESLLFWAVASAVVVLFVMNRVGKAPVHWKQLSKNDWLLSALMGFFNPFLYYLVLFKAYQLLEAQEAGTLNYIWPVVLVLFSIFFLKQKIRFWAVVALLVSFFGLIVIVTAGRPFSLHFHHPLGAALAVGSAVFWAAYWILNMKDSREESGKILLNMLFGLFYLSVYFALRGKWPQIPSLYGWAGTIYIGIFEMSLTFVIWLKALNYSEDTAKVSNLIYLSPFLGLFWIQQTVGEHIHGYTLVGLAFIVGGIVLQQGQKRISSTKTK
jgi:drug/metabolite transporter (DMT)-like permease